MENKTRKREKISAYFSEKEVKEIKKYAKLENRTLSNFIRTSALYRVNQAQYL